MELEPSDLGTREYWERAYSTELDNFLDHGDIGEIWFGEESIFRIIKWLKTNHFPKENRVVDIGCGNAMTLVEMAREGFRNLVGVDYSDEAIKLASRIVAEQNMQNEIKLLKRDILCESCDMNDFDLVLDKGTYDAVSLNPENPQEKRLAYIQKIREITKPGGFFIITSCNWSEKELAEHYGTYFKIYGAIPTPQFSFGGKVGNLVSCLVLQKIS